MTRPTYPRYLDRNWAYVPAEKTDIRATFDAARAELAEQGVRPAAASAPVRGFELLNQRHRTRRLP